MKMSSLPLKKLNSSNKSSFTLLEVDAFRVKLKFKVKMDFTELYLENRLDIDIKSIVF
jgi:hypothetical protein